MRPWTGVNGDLCCICDSYTRRLGETCLHTVEAMCTYSDITEPPRGSTEVNLLTVYFMGWKTFNGVCHGKLPLQIRRAGSYHVSYSIREPGQSDVELGVVPHSLLRRRHLAEQTWTYFASRAAHASCYKCASGLDGQYTLRQYCYWYQHNGLCVKCAEAPF